MVGSTLVTAFGFLVPCATALIVAHLHRKQMRQAELFRAGKTTEIVPPAGRTLSFLRKNKFMLLGVGGPVLSLSIIVGRAAPLTRFEVLAISLNVAVMLAVVVLSMLLDLIGLIREMYTHLRSLISLIEANAESTGTTKVASNVAVEPAAKDN